MDKADSRAVDPHKMPDALGWFKAAAKAVHRATRGTFRCGHWAPELRAGDRWVPAQLVNAHPPEQGREWHCEMQTAHKTHAAVLEVLRLEHRPLNLHALVLEWPSLSTDMRLAYTQMNRDGTPKKVRTVTTPGRYLKRHWPRLADDVIRDVVARVCAECVVWHTTDDIVRSVQEGPRSCMQWTAETECLSYLKHTGGKHPYMVYAPQFGWRAVVRIEDGRILGRCLLLMKNRGDYKPGESLAGAVFVRTYKRDQDNGYSYADEAMDAFLRDAGAHKHDGWPEGALLLNTPGARGSEFLAPYIDGENNYVGIDGDTLVINGCEDGYECTSTSGGHSDMSDDDDDDDDYSTCEDCDDRADSEEGSIVGRHQSRWVCRSCSENYVEVTGYLQNTYLVHEDDAVYVDGHRHFDVNYLAINDIVRLEGGDYAHTDDAFCCEVDGTWYLTDDGVTTEDKDGLVHNDNTWACAVSGLLYSTDEAYEILADGDWCHADHLPEDEGEDTAERGIEATGLLFPERDARVLKAEQEAQAATLPAQAEATSSRLQFTGPPPSIGWWRTTHADCIGSHESRHLYRYWNGAVWSMDARSSDPAEVRQEYKSTTAYTQQHLITHTRTRAPWDRDEPEAPMVARCIIDPGVAIRFLDQAPPYDGWWNLMFAQPISSTYWANEFGLVIGGRITHYTTSTLADRVRRLPEYGAASNTWWRNRHPAWWSPAAPHFFYSNANLAATTHSPATTALTEELA